MLRRVLLGTMMVCVACGSSNNNKTPDAAKKNIDAPIADATPDAGSGSGSGAGSGSGSGSGAGSGSDTDTVVSVTCAGATIAATVTTPGDEHMYVSTPSGGGTPTNSNSPIKVGDIIEFKPDSDHPVGPNTGGTGGPSDPGLVAPGGQTTSLQFTATGTFHYWCTIHLFTATVTVSPN